MKDFIKLNRGKILFGLKWSSIVFTSFVLSIFTYSHLTGKGPELELMLIVLFVAGIVSPVFVMVMGTLSGFLEYKTIKKTFNKYPFNQLAKWGFREVPMNEETNWTLTMVKLVGYFDDYPILCKAEDGLLKVIAITRKELVYDMHVAELKLKFGESKISYESSGIGMSYTATGDTLLTFGQMESELRELVKYFKERGIESSEMTASSLGIKAYVFL